MTFDRAKILAEGGTYHGADNPLIERASFVASKVSFEPVALTGPTPVTIREDSNLPKRMVIEGVFQKADTRNANQRVYPRTLWEKLLSADSAVQLRIADRAMIGHLEHPETGTTDLKQGAIRIDKVWMESDGTIYGRAIVYNNPHGQMLQEYIVTGTKVGISSRGTGTVDAKGHVCEDFALETWDMVYNPSTPGAHPTLRTEATEQPDHAPTVVEAKSSNGILPPQDKPMNVAERISLRESEAARLLAVDPKRLTVETRKALAADIVNLRIAVAEEFTGEKRIVAEKLLSKLTAAQKIAEGESAAEGAAPEGQTDGAGVPGTWDALDKVVATSGAASADHTKNCKSMAEMIASNIGKLPEVVSAVEAVIKGTEPAVAEAQVDEESKSLLAEARDELIKMTEREEAASAIIEEMAKRLAEAETKVKSLVSESAGLKAIADKSAEVIADLTSAKPAAKVTEATEGTKVPEAAPAKKTLAERLAKDAKPEGDTALPPKDAVVESAKDAGVTAKSVIAESAVDKAVALAAVALKNINKHDL